MNIGKKLNKKQKSYNAMDKLEVNRRTNRLWNIRKIIKNNQCCLICLKRMRGKIKKYKTNC